jgi:hypothetical protein
MAQIVLVHGIAQEQRAADALENEWLPALAGGVRLAGYPNIADQLWRDRAGPRGINARMAFYGHLFLGPGQQGGDPGEFNEEEALVAEQLAHEWLERAASRIPQSENQTAARRELAFLDGEPKSEAQGRGRLVRSAIRCAARVPWFARLGVAFAQRFVEKSLAQVTRYLTNDEIREKALQSVFDLVGQETTVVIGHSLGSVVAYEAAQQLRQPLPLLVTLGSPLGLDAIVYPRLRPQPPAFPAGVRRWINVASTDDFIAAEPDLRPMFSNGIPEQAVFEGSHTVDNGAQPHRCDFYLGKAEVGKPVGETLSGAR